MPRDIFTTASAAGKLFLHLLLPRTCLHCRRDLAHRREEPLCPGCASLLEPVPELFCQRCGVPLPDGGAHCFHCRGSKAARYKCSLIRSALVFSPQARSLVHHFKYRGKTTLAPYLAQFLAGALDRYGELAAFGYLAAVPVSEKRLRERGYNQSELLARELAKITGMVYLEDALRKVRETKPQVSLNRSARSQNLAGAFSAEHCAAARGKSVLIIDDVATTGSTLEACAAALKRSGSRRAAGLTLARE
ncbi:MAG: ComF family protein [Elusimicrobiales bacterium]|nr:ComF family protein [Elusimicrobiales bacterium]